MDNSASPSPLQIKDLGLTDYTACRELQLATQHEVIEGNAPETVFFTEHRPVYTLGRHGKTDNLLFLPKGVECIRIERGGDITYHGPGQIVVYPILNLWHRKLGIKDYINTLEEIVIRLIATYGIKGERVEGATGVWIGAGTKAERKICAIGVKVTRGVTMHGFALNVNTDLSAFSAINPCGFTDKGVTSISAELRTPATDLTDLKTRLTDILRQLL